MKIKLFCMDIDGTLTDGVINIGLKGEIFKSFNVKDGYGIQKLQAFGIVPVIISAGKTPINKYRFKTLGIKEIYQGTNNKIIILKELSKKYKCDFREIAYIGDDDNDLDCLKICGISACPNDSLENVKKEVDYICMKAGGYGAVREFIEFVLDKN